MNSTGHDDLLQYYTNHMGPGLVDLSSSSAPVTSCSFAFKCDADSLGYVPPSGATALAERIAARYEHVRPEDILVTAGASEALVAAVFAIVSRGDAVACIGGCYPSASAALETAGAVTGTIEPAKLILACNPTAPDGILLDIPRLALDARDAGAVLVVDEVYRDIALSGDRPPAAADVDPDAVSIGDLSKPLGMGGLRIGWLATRNEELRNRLDRSLQLLSGGPSSLSVEAATQEMETYQEKVDAALDQARAGLPGLLSVLDRAGWRYALPESGPTFLSRPPSPVEEEDLQRARDAGYFLLPGETLGRKDSLRISIFASPQDLDAAIRAIEDYHAPARRCGNSHERRRQ